MVEQVRAGGPTVTGEGFRGQYGGYLSPSRRAPYSTAVSAHPANDVRPPREPGVPLAGSFSALPSRLTTASRRAGESLGDGEPVRRLRAGSAQRQILGMPALGDQ